MLLFPIVIENYLLRVFSQRLPIAENMKQFYLLLDLFPIGKSNLVVTSTNAELKGMTFLETKRRDIMCFGFLF